MHSPSSEEQSLRSTQYVIREKKRFWNAFGIAFCSASVVIILLFARRAELCCDATTQICHHAVTGWLFATTASFPFGTSREPRAISDVFVEFTTSTSRVVLQLSNGNRVPVTPWFSSFTDQHIQEKTMLQHFLLETPATRKGSICIDEDLLPLAFALAFVFLIIGGLAFVLPSNDTLIIDLLERYVAIESTSRIRTKRRARNLADLIDIRIEQYGNGRTKRFGLCFDFTDGETLQCCSLNWEDANKFNNDLHALLELPIHTERPRSKEYLM